MSRFLVLGAGPLGTTTAELLVAQGHDVTVVTRGGAAVPGVRPLALDVRDGDLAAAAEGADAIISAINPDSYGRWDTLWPPILKATLGAARSAGAVHVQVGNLYGYAPPDGPLTPDSPVGSPTANGRARAAMWERQRAAAADGLRVVEVRGSDYIGGEVGPDVQSLAGAMLVRPVLAGSTVRVLGDPDAPHTWTAVSDFAATLAALALDERAWGEAWHVPSAPARSIRQVARDIAAEAGAPEPRVRAVPHALLRAAGLVSPSMRAIAANDYQVRRPFVADGAETTEVFGIEPTDWDETIAGVVAAARGWDGVEVRPAS